MFLRSLLLQRRAFQDMHWTQWLLFCQPVPHRRGISALEHRCTTSDMPRHSTSVPPRSLWHTCNQTRAPGPPGPPGWRAMCSRTRIPSQQLLDPRHKLWSHFVAAGGGGAAGGVAVVAVAVIFAAAGGGGAVAGGEDGGPRRGFLFFCAAPCIEKSPRASPVGGGALPSQVIAAPSK